MSRVELLFVLVYMVHIIMSGTYINHRLVFCSRACIGLAPINHMQLEYKWEKISHDIFKHASKHGVSEDSSAVVHKHLSENGVATDVVSVHAMTGPNSDSEGEK